MLKIQNLKQTKTEIATKLSLQLHYMHQVKLHTRGCCGRKGGIGTVSSTLEYPDLIMGVPLLAWTKDLSVDLIVFRLKYIRKHPVAVDTIPRVH
jgi:hypothetical protein